MPLSVHSNTTNKSSEKTSAIARQMASIALSTAATLLTYFNANAQVLSPNIESPADPRGKIELTVCSQNLENYGSLADVKGKKFAFTAQALKEKEDDLVKRFVAAQCDVIAVQELLAKDELIGEIALNTLAKSLQKATNRFFKVKAGASNDPKMRNGFLVAQDRAEILNSIAYNKVELPKLSETQKPRFFARGPFEIQLQVKPRDESYSKTVTLVTFHFKSGSGAAADAAGLQWETYRMEMAEALRRVVEHRHEQSFGSGDTILILLGDRNSDTDLASAKILEGTLTLADFQGENPTCRLSKRGVPLCKTEAAKPQKLFSVLLNDPETSLEKGTFKFQKTYSWLDDILLPAESLRFSLENVMNDGNYDSGVEYSPHGASDHALVYVRLNW